MLVIDFVCYLRNVTFLAGSLLAVLLVMTVIQEDLLTAQHVLTIITGLGECLHIYRPLLLPNVIDRYYCHYMSDMDP